MTPPWWFKPQGVTAGWVSVTHDTAVNTLDLAFHTGFSYCHPPWGDNQGLVSQKNSNFKTCLNPLKLCAQPFFTYIYIPDFFFFFRGERGGGLKIVKSLGLKSKNNQVLKFYLRFFLNLCPSHVQNSEKKLKDSRQPEAVKSEEM